jgi:hypothetical protein
MSDARLTAGTDLEALARREADAYRAGLEAAAKVAESRVAPDAHPNSIAAFMSKDIAAAIRSMKDATP